MSRWHIYIDESGRRDRGGDHIHLAGFICHNDGQGTLAAFERACRDDLGFLPWPLHTAHLNMPVALILALRVASDADVVGMNPRSAAQPGDLLTFTIFPDGLPEECGNFTLPFPLRLPDILLRHRMRLD